MNIATRSAIAAAAVAMVSACASSGGGTAVEEPAPGYAPRPSLAEAGEAAQAERVFRAMLERTDSPRVKLELALVGALEENRSSIGFHDYRKANLSVVVE